MAAAEQERLTVAAVARRIGVAPATLRTWDRRYGLGPSDHQEGEHRRYTAEDVATLTTMRRLIVAGVSPAEAAEQALAHKGDIKIEQLVKNFQVRSDVVDAIVKAAQSLDRNFVDALLRQEISQCGVIDSWHEVMVPVLIIVGDIWAKTGEGIEVEHLLSESITNVFREFARQIESPINPRPVVLASVGEEVHSLALYALNAALAEINIDCHVMGARTPLEALSKVVNRSAPPAIFLWAQLAKNGDPIYFKNIPDIRPAPRVVLGGPGWDRKQCADIPFAEDLSFACSEIKQAIGA